ncbi:hypothetical protein NUW54_g1853 [Trametes sanguinea]|uniref:Uncharacterized protein n=1 Tax=Trametes sanguinea TaxID=158606 RepID=A0ACC1Q8Z7_9APHY|nr:hypothetical protein NUW54_g1853 [Trametes sanguinea]
MQYSAVLVTLVAVVASSALTTPTVISPDLFPSTATTAAAVSSAPLAMPQIARVLLPPSTQAWPTRTKPSSPPAIATTVRRAPFYPTYMLMSLFPLSHLLPQSSAPPCSSYHTVAIVRYAYHRARPSRTINTDSNNNNNVELHSAFFTRELRQELTPLPASPLSSDYATNGECAQPVSGAVIIDTAPSILNSNLCGSIGTNHAGCPSCHVTLNYRA